jgi:hypothetical protein
MTTDAFNPPRPATWTGHQCGGSGWVHGLTKNSRGEAVFVFENESGQINYIEAYLVKFDRPMEPKE